MFSVDHEIGVHSHDGMIFMEFSHTNDTGIGQRHRRILIFSQQPVYRADVVFQPKSQHDGAIREKTEQCILGFWEAREQVHHFGQHSLTDQKWRIEAVDPLSDPAMIVFRSIEEGNKRPGVNDRLHLARNP